MLRDLHTFLDKVSTPTNNIINTDRERDKYKVVWFGLQNLQHTSKLQIHFVQLLTALSAQAVPDTKLTLKKYSGAKFEFLVMSSLCLFCLAFISTKLKIHFEFLISLSQN